LDGGKRTGGKKRQATNPLMPPQIPKCCERGILQPKMSSSGRAIAVPTRVPTEVKSRRIAIFLTLRCFFCISNFSFLKRE